MEKTVLVTGVSRGIGRAIAETFLANDYTLYGTFFENRGFPVENDNANSLVEKYGENRVHLFRKYDFTKVDDIFKLLAELQTYTFDSVVCSAGIFVDGFNQTMNCNFYSQLILTTGLKDNIKPNGSIVLMSSNDSFSGAYSSMAYCISKAAVASLAKCLCVNFGKKNIRVNSIAPGAIDTYMNTPEQMNIAPYFTPSKRAGNPVDVAQVVYFLSSSAASFVNGVNLTIDGGNTVESLLLKSEDDPKLSALLQYFAKNYPRISVGENDGQLYMEDRPLFSVNS